MVNITSITAGALHHSPGVFPWRQGPLILSNVGKRPAPIPEAPPSSLVSTYCHQSYSFPSPKTQSVHLESRTDPEPIQDLPFCDKIMCLQGEKEKRPHPATPCFCLPLPTTPAFCNINHNSEDNKATVVQIVCHKNR